MSVGCVIKSREQKFYIYVDVDVFAVVAALAQLA